MNKKIGGTVQRGAPKINTWEDYSGWGTQGGVTAITTHATVNITYPHQSKCITFCYY